MSVVITVGGDDVPVLVNDPFQPSECVILIIDRIAVRQCLGLDSDQGLDRKMNQKVRPRDSYPGRGAVGIVGDVCDAPAQCINKTVLQSHFISLTSFFLRVYLVFLFKYSIVCA